MSLAMRQAQGDFDGGTFQGDPGIFGTLKGLGGKALRIGASVLPGPIGIVARAGIKRFGGGAPAGTGERVLPGIGAPTRFQQRIASERAARVAAGRPARVGRGFGGGGQVPESLEFEIPGFKGKAVRGILPLPENGVTVGSTGQPIPACPVGFHANKSGYYRQSPAGGVIFIQPMSVCVRNRRIDPGNTRATKRAISRIRSAKRLKDALGGVTVHKKPC